MTDDDVIKALLQSASDDWVMLHDILWESTKDERTPAAKATIERVLERLFTQELLVPGDLGETGFTDWSGRPEDWLPRAKAILRACDWQPMGDGFWLRLTRNGETWLAVHRALAGAPECPNNDQGMVRPLVTQSGVVVLMCDEGNEVWLHPNDIDRIDPIVPSEPSWAVNEWVHIAPGTTRWATSEDLPDGWPTLSGGDRHWAEP